MLEATGVEFDWDRREAGIDDYERSGNPFPDATLDSIRRNGVGIKGPTTTPVGSGFRSVNVLLRKELDLFCLHPPLQGLRGRAHALPRDRHRDRAREHRGPLRRHRVREGDARGRDSCAPTSSELGAKVREDAGISIKPISVFGSERIVRAAFEYARANGRRKVTAAHKANIMKFSDGLFLEVARQVAEDFPDIEFEDRIIDNLCNQLVSRPEEYDVIVLPNLYGDIVSDLGAGMIGGLGLAPGANIGTARRDVRGHPRLGSEVQGAEQGEPDGAHAVRRADAAPPGRDASAADRLERAIAGVIAKGDTSHL